MGNPQDSWENIKEKFLGKTGKKSVNINNQLFYLNFVFFSVAQSAESTGMPQLNPEFWISQIFWLVLTFGMLFIILSKLILPKISKNDIQRF